MVVTGFEIYGAFGTSIALLNLARQGYGSLVETYSEYCKAGSHILAAQRHCSMIYFNVQGWIKFWGFDKLMTDELYKAYWGEDGWNEIGSQLAVVSIKCADLAAFIDKALPPTNIYDQLPEDDRRRARECLDRRAPPVRVRQAFGLRIPRFGTDQKVEEIRLLEEHMARRTSAFKKGKYVLSSSKKVQKHLKALEDDFDALKRLVKTAWPLQHPNVDYRSSTLIERHLAALTNARRFLVQEAKEDRQAAKALYSCCSTTRQALKLELSLLDTSGGLRNKRFHIFVPTVPYHDYLEMSTVILRDDPPLPNLDWQDNLRDACDKVCQEERGFLCLPSANQNGIAGSLREARDKLWFSLGKRAMHVGGLNLSRLNVSLVSLVAAERLELAYSVVETGLILLGTPWLSSLSSTALKRFKTGQQPPRYVLEINELHNLVRMRLWDQNKDLHLYIFTIGIILVEIALRTVIRDLRQLGSRLEFFVAGSDGEKWRSANHVTSLVSEQLGAAYSDAVKFCLQDPVHAPNDRWKEGVLKDTTLSEEQVSLELLDLFYEKVLIK